MHRLRSDGLSWREVDGEVLALDHRTSVYVSANGSGLPLWRALVRGATHGELVDCLVDEFGIGRETAGHDVDRFLGELAEQGLLEP